MSGPGGPRSGKTLGAQPFDDGVDVHAGAVDAGEACRCLIEDHGQVGAGEQDRLDAIATLQVGRDAAQAGGVIVVAALGVEDALVGPADKAISSACGFTISTPESWPHRLPCMVKVVPNSATR